MTRTCQVFVAIAFFFSLFVQSAKLHSEEYSWFNPCYETDGFHFESGFEDDVSVSDSSDGKNARMSSAVAPKCSVEPRSLRDKARFGKLSIQYDGGQQTDRLATITTDPVNNKNKVLSFGISKPNVMGQKGFPIKGRVQMNVYGNKGLKHLKMSVRLFLPTDLKLLNSYPEKIDWLTISEWWNNASWSKEQFPFRISVNLYKDPGSNPLLLKVHAQPFVKEDKRWENDIWEAVNRDFTVPIGKWMTVEYEFVEGDKNQGQFMVAVTPDGEKRTVVFDIHNYTYHPDDPNPDGLSHFNPLKLYTSVKVINYLNSQGANLKLYWDDLNLQGAPN